MVKKEALDENTVRNGFTITRSIEETRRLYDELVQAGLLDPEGKKHKG